MGSATSRPARAALYARISTREGRQHLENQLTELRAYAGRMRWKIAGTYTDEETGASSDRPGLNRLMADAARGRFEIVAVADLSRFTRKGPGEAFFLIARLSRSGVDFWSVHEEHFRTPDGTGEIFVAIAAHIARAERALMQNRIRAGLDRARRRGVRLGRAPAVFDRQRAQDMRRQGKSLREIAALLKVSPATVQRHTEGNYD